MDGVWGRGGEGCLPACATYDRRACLEGRAASREDMPPTLSSILTRAARGFFQLDATPPHLPSLCRVACPSSCLPPSSMAGHMCVMPASQPASQVRWSGVVCCGVVCGVRVSVRMGGWWFFLPLCRLVLPLRRGCVCLYSYRMNDSIQWWCGVVWTVRVSGGGSVLIQWIHP